ncbi:hypothetical protein SNE25_20270 [Mucilaginibacter sabulilitoris]|uniref:Glycosyltransferase family 2 protein n=1 Tax=Mucilaginibacter sabulilitoris TaxID=1173583 RepID=A0ABZ0TGX0_9SPHI|nr:hypothetical protein [Mucilaginibacter sabulilitoris]WPU91657.1 hypothetical protein SNE25_20270 [Mucilaginibacter sabulilitoris]
MRSAKEVSLQINLFPGDYPHVRHILPHQLKTLSAQVDEIILTIDTKPSKGRFAAGWQEYSEIFEDFLHFEIKPFFNVRIIPVDYNEKVKAAISNFFFNNSDMPGKDFRGGPFYAYFFGLYSTTHDLVFHLDSDILLGGSSQKWITEARSIFDADPRCFTISPLPGPPHPRGVLIGQPGAIKIGDYKYQFNGMSTRLFLLNKVAFRQQKLTINKPGLRDQLKAMVQGNPNADLPEHIISAFMKKHNRTRIDFLGSGSGLWSLHPPYRTKAFYEQLQSVVKLVELNQLPENQNGFYDLIDEVCDWGEARTNLIRNRWWKN